MKRIVAGLLTAFVLVVVLWFSRGATSRRGGSPDPESCIQRMFEAAGQGDVAAYLDCFAGLERDRLERELQNQSEERFAASLIQAVSKLKGRAVYANTQPPVERPSGSQETAFYIVERIYEGRTDRQELRLVRNRTGWQIQAVSPSQSIQPTVPYGTPVFEIQDESASDSPMNAQNLDTKTSS